MLSFTRSKYRVVVFSISNTILKHAYYCEIYYNISNGLKAPEQALYYICKQNQFLVISLIYIYAE